MGAPSSLLHGARFWCQCKSLQRSLNPRTPRQDAVMQAGHPTTPCSRCKRGLTWSRAQMQSLGMQPRRPNRWRRRKRSPGAKSRMFIFTDTARLSGKLCYSSSPLHGSPGIPQPKHHFLPGAELTHICSMPWRAAPALRHLPEEETAPGPALLQEEVDGKEEDGHGDRVIEEPQDKDGVDAVGSAAHEEEHIRGHLGRGQRDTRAISSLS